MSSTGNRNKGGRKRGLYGKDTCPRCGATRSTQRYPIRRPMLDVSVMQSIDSLHPADCVVCKECGMAFRVAKLDVEDGYLVSEDERECVPNFCPSCGAELAE